MNHFKSFLFICYWIIYHKPSWAHVGGAALPQTPLYPNPPRATATAAADEFSWRIQPPSTHAGITYPVRRIPHSDEKLLKIHREETKTTCGRRLNICETKWWYTRSQACGREALVRRRLCVLCFWLFYIMNIYGYSLYIPYIFPKYALYLFPCVLLTLWSQQ